MPDEQPNPYVDDPFERLRRPSERQAERERQQLLAERRAEAAPTAEQVAEEG